MLKENETPHHDQNERDAEHNENSPKPNAYRVEDDDNLEEKDLKTHYLFGDSEMKDPNAPGMEGQGMGGQAFGQNNLTPSGDDKDNPSQNAGQGNAYFNRTQPAEEHPENSNFKPGNQDNTYQEGTADNDGKGTGQTIIPGPNEVPDQQKVGEGLGRQDDGKDHIET
jgi:hypothetical protein